MTRQIRRRAAYELPVPIWMAAEVLSKTFSTSFCGIEFKVHMPRRGDPDGLAPDIEGMAALQVGWTHRFAAWPTDGREDSLAVCRVGLTAQQDVETDDPDARLDAVIDDWFDCVRTWVEVETGQDLDPHHRVYDAQELGRGLSYLDADETVHGLQLTTRRVNPLPAARWPVILDRVSQGNPPPLEDVLCRDARAAHMRGYYRRSAIEAAIASEVLLVQILNEYADSLSSRDRKALGGKPTFGSCIGIVERSSLQLPVSIEQLRQLNDARIDAVHHGKAMSDTVSRECVQTSIDLVTSRVPKEEAAG